MERQRPTARERDTVFEVEIVSAQPNKASNLAPPAGSSLMRSLVGVAVVTGVIGLLALLVAVAATIALIALPVAIGAGFIAWLGLTWRTRRGR